MVSTVSLCAPPRFEVHPLGPIISANPASFSVHGQVCQRCRALIYASERPRSTEGAARGSEVNSRSRQDPGFHDDSRDNSGGPNSSRRRGYVGRMKLRTSGEPCRQIMGHEHHSGHASEKAVVKRRRNCMIDHICRVLRE